MPTRLIREGILTSERVNKLSLELSYSDLPNPRSIISESEILLLRGRLPRVNAGHWLQSYRWQLAMQLRKLRGGHVPQSTAKKLVAESSNECPVCGNDMRFFVSRRWPTIDHIIPVAKGGTNEELNLRVICNRCNSSKKDN